MKKVFLIILCISYFSCFGQKAEKLNGKFEYNRILNSYLELNESERLEYKKVVQSVDTALLNQYFELIFAATFRSLDDSTNFDLESYVELSQRNYQKADSLLSTDSLLSGMSGRMVAMLYTENELIRMGFRDKDYYAISQDILTPDGTINVFLTKEQYEKLRKKLGKQIRINVQFVKEIKWTKFKVYILASSPN